MKFCHIHRIADRYRDDVSGFSPRKRGARVVRPSHGGILSGPVSKPASPFGCSAARVSLKTRLCAITIVWRRYGLTCNYSAPAVVKERSRFPK